MNSPVEMLTIETPFLKLFPVENHYYHYYYYDLIASYYIRSYYFVFTCVNSTRNNGGLS